MSDITEQEAQVIAWEELELEDAILISESIERSEWYVVTNNTSWIDVEVALVSCPYTSKVKADINCADTSEWSLILTKQEAAKITY